MRIRAIETLHLHTELINRRGTEVRGGVGRGTRGSVVNGEKRSQPPFAATARNGL